ncbi:MAG: hypothetical protein WKG01_28380 [Kofleriaceae bacterium]
MRLVLACVVGLVAHDAHGHYSASRSTRLRGDRHLICYRAEDAARVDCVGPHRARATLLANLTVGELVPGKNHSLHVDRARDAALDAVYFSVREAIPKLRLWLTTQRPDARDENDHVMFDKQALRAEAAYALAHLGDVTSVPGIVALVGEFETTGTGFMWGDTLAALAKLDPARASRYVIGFAGRTTDWRTSMRGGGSKLAALEHIRVEDAAAALPVLARLAKREETGYDHAHCELQATRVRLDEPFRADVRKQLLGHYSGTWLAGCANSVIAQLGVMPADAEALVRHLGRDDQGMDMGVANISYSRILELETKLDGGAASEAARKILRQGLVKRSTWPHVADLSHRNYELHFVALHHAALAGIGDAGSRSKLFALIDDAKDVSGSAWLAAYWALRLRLPGAPDRAAALAARSVTTRNTNRSGVFERIRGRTLDAFADAAPSDGRWAVMLLDGDADASERALYRLSRSKPAGACEAVTRAAPAIAGSSVMTQTDNAFLALTTLGTTCLPALEQLFLDRTVTKEVRTSALEIVAALESPRTCSHFVQAQRDRIFTAPALRAAALAKPCN